MARANKKLLSISVLGNGESLGMNDWIDAARFCEAWTFDLRGVLCPGVNNADTISFSCPEVSCNVAIRYFCFIDLGLEKVEFLV